MKKNLKLASAALIGTGLILGFSGCGKKDPYTVYSEAAKKNSEMKSAEATAEMNVNMSAQGLSLEIPITMDMKMSDLNTEDMKLAMDMSMEMMGQGLDMSMYYTDGYYYIDSGDYGKIKYAMDIKELEEQLSASQIQTDLAKEDFEELTMEKKDSDYILTYKIKGDQMDDLVESALSAMGDLAESLDMDFSIQDITGTMTVNKDGYIASSSMTLPMSTEIESQEISMDMNIDITYKDPGKDVSVELPDLEDFQETTMPGLDSGLSGTDDLDGLMEDGTDIDVEDDEDAASDEDSISDEDTDSDEDSTSDEDSDAAGEGAAA